MTTTLDQIQQLVDQLTPLEQVRLLEYLTPRIAQAVATTQCSPSAPQSSLPEAWKEFFRVGDALAATDTPDVETLTEAVFVMRR